MTDAPIVIQPAAPLVQLNKPDKKTWQLICLAAVELELTGTPRIDIFQKLKARYPQYAFSFNSFSKRLVKYHRDRSFLITPDLADTLMNQFKTRFDKGMAGAELNEDWGTYLRANFEYVKVMQSIGAVPQVTGAASKMPDENIQVIDQVIKEVHKKKLEEQNAKLNIAKLPSSSSESEDTRQENT